MICLQLAGALLEMLCIFNQRFNIEKYVSMLSKFKLLALIFFTTGTAQFAQSNILQIHTDVKFFDGDGKTQTDTLRDSVSVLNFGAKGDEITNDFQAIQNAINYIASKKGGIVFFPKGIYLVEGKNNGLTDGLNITGSDITLSGEGSNSVIKQGPNSFYALSINNNNTGSNFVKDNVKNIKVTGIKFMCDIEALGFSEFRHLLNINAASNVKISHCVFAGFRGDGILLGSGNTAGIERHNENIAITNCLFDGVNNDNRNGISIIDVNGLIIDSCIFRRTTRQNMPGAIDIEPDTYSYFIVKNILIQNSKFDSTGGNSAAISYNGNSKLGEQINNLKVINNQIQNGLNIGSAFTFQSRRNPTSSTVPNNIVVKNNTVKNYYQSIQVFGIKNILFDSNTFDSTIRSGVIGFTDVKSQKNADVRLYNNTFRNNGYKAHAGLIFFSGDNIELKNNLFEDCGSSLDPSANAVDFKGNPSDNILLKNNVSKNNHTKTSKRIQRESNDIFTSAKKIFLENKLILSTIILMQLLLTRSGVRKKRELQKPIRN